jgi:hypothetical protein
LLSPKVDAQNRPGFTYFDIRKTAIICFLVNTFMIMLYEYWADENERQIASGISETKMGSAFN